MSHYTVSHCKLCGTHKYGGGERDRTDDPLLAKQVLSQLSYTPVLVGLGGFEPPTPRLSSVCSNQLSYKPYSWLELKSLAQSNSQLLLTQPISVNACNQAFL